MNAPPLNGLGAARIFRDLAPAAMERLASVSEQLQLATSEPLLSGRPDQGHDVWIVVEGRIRVFRELNPAGDVTLGEIGPGGLVGEFAAIHGVAGTAKAEAVGPSVVVRVPREAFLAVLEEHPRVTLRLCEHLITLVRALDQRLVALEGLDRAVDSTLKRLFLATL